MKNWLNIDFGGRYAASWPTILLYAIPSLWVTLIYDQNRLGGSGLSWFILASATYLATVAPLVLARYTYLSTEREEIQPFLTVLTYLVASLTRISVTLPLGVYLGLLPETEIAYRIFSAPIHVIVWFSLISMLVSARLNHRDIMVVLTKRFGELQAKTDALEAAVRRDSKSALDRVLEKLDPFLKELRAGLGANGTNSQKVVLQENLKLAIENVVRPMSLELARSAKLDIEGGADKPRQVRQFRFPIAISLRDVNSPWLVAGIALFSISIPIIHIYGWIIFVTVAIPTVIFTWLSGFALNLLVPSKHLSLLAIFLIQSFGYGLSSFVAVSLFGLQQEQMPANLHFQYFGLVQVSVVMVTIYKLALLGQRKLEEQAESLNRNFELLAAKLSLRLWVARNQLATTLHGPIQAAFQVVAMKLGATEKIGDDLINEAEEIIGGALAELNKPPIASLKVFEETMQEVIELWSGLIDIEWSFPEETRPAVEYFPLTLRCALEVMREGLANAWKHGRAQHASLEILVNDEILEISIWNDGLPVPADHRLGFGSQMIEEISLGWNLRPERDGTSLSVKLPLV